MNKYFSIGELSKHQNISRQTLIFYDKIGLFKPAYVDPLNGYRYYSANQLDVLDTICVMKKVGFSLDEIKNHMKNYNLDSSLIAMRKQLTIIDNQIKELELIKSCLIHRCNQLELSSNITHNQKIHLENIDKQYLLLQEVDKPYTLDMVSIATKKIFVRAFKQHLPVFFQSGVIVPLSNIKNGEYIKASYAFLPIEKCDLDGAKEIPSGKCVVGYHSGDYLSISKTYNKILEYVKKHKLKITSNAYEFAINDSLSTGDEKEYLTKIMFYVE